jgi:hypothetical protein
VPYLDSAVEYPVLTGGFMALAAGIAGVYDGAGRPSACCPRPAGGELLRRHLPAAVALRAPDHPAVLGLSGRRPWDAAMVGLSPLLLVHAFTNWDLFAVALTTLGMWAWARSRPVLAGVLLGLGIAAKLYPVLLLGVLFLLCLRAGRLRAWLRRGGRGAVAWLVVNVPIAVLAPANWAGSSAQRQPAGRSGHDLEPAAGRPTTGSSTGRWPRGRRRRCSTRSSPSPAGARARVSPG